MDLAANWAKPEMATAQWDIVYPQLVAMFAGHPPRHFQIFGELFQQLRDLMNVPRCTLLDVGCASAYYYDIIGYYTPNWVDYTGVDYNPTMLELARERHPHLALIYGNTNNIDAESRAYDIILSGAVIVHVDNWKLAVSELGRVADKFLILHRTWVYVDRTPTRQITKPSYDDILVRFITINEHELLDYLHSMGFELVLQANSGESPREKRAIKTYIFQRSEEA